MSQEAKQTMALDEALAKIVQLSELCAKLQRENQLLRDRVHSMARRQFGRSSEKFHDSNQLALFDEQPLVMAPAAPPPAPKKRPGPPPVRSALPVGLPRVKEVLEIEPEDLLCKCCDPPKDLKPIRYEVTETLEYKPAELFVKEVHRPVAACPSGKGTVIAPLVTPRLLPKARVGVSLLVYVVLSKYQDHLPLYRIHRVLKRSGINIPESTLCDWVGAVTDALAPLVLLMKRFLLGCTYLQADETPADVKDLGLKGKHRRVYFWVYCRPWADVVFDYRTSRSSEGPLDFLDGWTAGRLQVDDYAGYNPVFTRQSGLVRVGCWAHARRKFKEAEYHRPEPCRLALGWLRAASHLETLMRAKGRSPAQRLAVRRRVLAPLLAKLHKLCEEGFKDPSVLPGSPFEKAIRYAHSNWATLEVFLDDGELEMDNNSAENTIRPFAVGRKNWLQIGHVQAGDRAAVMYSLLVTCSRLGINPQEYLTDVMNRLPSHPRADQWALTPRGWMEARSVSTGPPQDPLPTQAPP